MVDGKELPETFWVTRGRRHGVLDDHIEIWAVLPDRLRCDDGDVVWFAPLDLIDREDTLIGDVSIGDAFRLIGNGYPQTDRECVRIGPELVAPVNS